MRSSFQTFTNAQRAGQRPSQEAWAGNLNYLQTGDKAGWAKDWQSSIPTAFEQRNWIMKNQQAKAKGFANWSDMDAYNSELNRIQTMKGRLGTNYGPGANGMYQPGVNMNPQIQAEIDARQGKIANWFTRRPYQNMPNAGRPQGYQQLQTMIGNLTPQQQSSFVQWLQQNGHIR